MANRLTVIAAAGFIALTSSFAYAEKIDLSEFDLTTTAGNEALYERIESTASQICAPALQAVSSDVRAFRRCIDEVVAATVEKSQLPSLTAYHAAKTDQPNRVAAAD